VNNYPKYKDASNNVVDWEFKLDWAASVYPNTTPAVGVRPYLASPGRYVKEQGFQIISAGRDGMFGPGGADNPATGVGADDMIHTQKEVAGAGIQ